MMTTEHLKSRYQSGFDLWQSIAKKSNTVFVAFSCGKDAITAYIEMKNSGLFKRIIPYYMYLIPSLGFIESSLKYYEDFFDTEILRIPHASLLRWIRNLTFQTPENAAIIERMDVPIVDYEDMVGCLARKYNLSDAYTIDGVRAADSPIRRLALSKYGPINETRRIVHAIWDYTADDVRRVISKANIKLPVDYEMFGRTFDGIDFRFLAPIKERFPDDYKKILDLFPLVELEFFRRTI